MRTISPFSTIHPLLKIERMAVALNFDGIERGAAPFPDTLRATVQSLSDLTVHKAQLNGDHHFVAEGRDYLPEEFFIS